MGRSQTEALGRIESKPKNEVLKQQIEDLVKPFLEDPEIRTILRNAARGIATNNIQVLSHTIDLIRDKFAQYKCPIVPSPELNSEPENPARLAHSGDNWILFVAADRFDLETGKESPLEAPLSDTVRQYIHELAALVMMEKMRQEQNLPPRELNDYSLVEKLKDQLGTDHDVIDSAPKVIDAIVFSMASTT